MKIERFTIKRKLAQRDPDIFNWFWLILWAQNQNFRAVNGKRKRG